VATKNDLLTWMPPVRNKTTKTLPRVCHLTLNTSEEEGRPEMQLSLSNIPRAHTTITIRATDRPPKPHQRNKEIPPSKTNVSLCKVPLSALPQAKII
jgi:hypothetical protein